MGTMNAVRPIAYLVNCSFLTDAVLDADSYRSLVQDMDTEDRLAHTAIPLVALSEEDRVRLLEYRGWCSIIPF